MVKFKFIILLFDFFLTPLFCFPFPLFLPFCELIELFFMIPFYLLCWFIGYKCFILVIVLGFTVHIVKLPVCLQVTLYHFTYSIRNLQSYTCILPSRALSYCCHTLILSMYKLQTTLLFFLFKQSIIF